jgi:hypothetical protein
VGENYGTVTQCYSTGSVNGDQNIGGLGGINALYSIITNCYSTGAASGTSMIGGLVGWNMGTLTYCYSIGAVSGNDYVGGLSGNNGIRNGGIGSTYKCFWDVQTSGQATSAGGIGKKPRPKCKQPRHF